MEVMGKMVISMYKMIYLYDRYKKFIVSCRPEKKDMEDEYFDIISGFGDSLCDT